jgi:hypothetical protein
MRKFTVISAVLAVAAALAVLPSVASADQTKEIFNGCSVTAYTPAYDGSGMAFSAGVSCGGQNYVKRMYVCDWQLVTGGWKVIPGTKCASNGSPYGEWTGTNPIGEWSYTSCVPGRWYATAAAGEIDDYGPVYQAAANTFSSGNQCP